MSLKKMHVICMNYFSVQRIGRRTEKLKEICVLMGKGEGSGAVIQKVLSPFLFWKYRLEELRVRPDGSKDSPECLALQTVPPGLV